MPSPVLSDNLRKACRERLLSSLAKLTAHPTLVKIGTPLSAVFPSLRTSPFSLPNLLSRVLGLDDKTSKVAAVASDGEFWVSKVLASIANLEQDTKHVSLLSEVDDDDQALRQKARDVIGHLRTVSDDRGC